MRQILTRADLAVWTERTEMAPEEVLESLKKDDYFGDAVQALIGAAGDLGEKRMKLEPTLGHDDAAAAIDAIRAELVARGRTAVIAVADSHGELMALLRLDGAPVSSVAVATAKAHETLVSFDVADPFVVGRNRETFLEVIAEDADIVFANDLNRHRQNNPLSLLF